MEDSVEPDPGAWGDELDRITTALSDKRRRYVIHHLAGDEGPTAVGELADEIAEWASGDHSAVETGLLHRHLPKLADAGLIAVDHDAGSVRLSAKGRRADEIRSVCVVEASAACK